MITVLSTLGVFTLVILFLAILIIVAESKLVTKGNVKIVINGDMDSPVEVESGSTLLNTLTGQGILLPSACGGQGTCGACLCKVTEGGGDLLPTEETFVNRKMAKENNRLSCQVKVREDMKIEVPEEVFSIKKWECEVISNNSVSTYMKEFVVKLPEGENLDFKSGGYIQIEVPKVDIDFKDMVIGEEYQDEWKENGLFNLKLKTNDETIRAYSMANHPAEGNIIMLNIRIAPPPWDHAAGRFAKGVQPGICSSYIFNLVAGDKITISGPYGEFFIQDTDREMIYLGGGAGMAPMRSHIFHLFHTLRTGRKVTFFYGARSKKEIFYEDQFRAIEKEFPNFKFHIAMSDPKPEDNWNGYVGFIHNGLNDIYLKDHEAPEDIEYYLCGPPVMTDAIEDLLYSLGVEDDMIHYDKF